MYMYAFVYVYICVCVDYYLLFLYDKFLKVELRGQKVYYI